MNKNLFWPIYQKLEEEFKELSYYISIDRKQLKTYSIKIADLILRTVAECENIASAICKNNKMKFIDKKGHIRKSVYFNEYIDELNKVFKLDKKLVNPIFNNIDSSAFDCKLRPFRKETLKVSGKEKEIIPWYNAYNKIKHDRVKNYKQANLENLITSLAGLFMLNIYLKNEIFYEQDDYDHKKIISRIEDFSDVFEIDYAVKANVYDNINIDKNSFFDPASFWEIALPMSVYVLEYDKEIKTSTDSVTDSMDKLESNILIRKPDGSFEKKHSEYTLKDHKTVCKLVAAINRD